MNRYIEFRAVFSTDEQIEFLEKKGWQIEKKEKEVWVQTGPYDRIGEYQLETKYYASTPTIAAEEIDLVFSREIEKKFKDFILNN
jgi:hypothetical protein